MTTKLAAASHAPSRPKDDPCTVCGRPYNVGKHYQRAPAGTRCGVDGCKAPMFERCFGAGGEVIAVRCIKNGHRRVAPV